MPSATRPDDLLPLAPASYHILLALAREDRHGYAIMQEVEERTDGKIRLSAGTLYRTIHKLLELGVVVEVRERPADDDERRRYYRLTPLGREAARAEAARLRGLVEMARERGLAPEEARG